MRPAVAAALQAVAAAAIVLAWLWMAPDTWMVDRLGPATATVLHVALTGALCTAIALLFAWRDPVGLRGLGLVRAPIGPAIGWGLAGVLLCYAFDIAAVALYFGARLATGAAHHLVGIVGPPGVVSDELADRARWMSQLGSIPLGWSIAVALFAGAYEELFFRGLLLGRIERALVFMRHPRARNIVAVLVTTVAFAAGHGYQGALGVAQTFAAGLALAVLAVWRRNIWSSMVAHAAVDVIGLVALHLIRPWLGQVVPPP